MCCGTSMRVIVAIIIALLMFIAWLASENAVDRQILITQHGE